LFGISRAALTHVEINMNKQEDIFHNLYCDKCKKYYSRLDKVDHCDICKVCVIKYDHHCVWVGKCVGKKNIKIRNTGARGNLDTKDIYQKLINSPYANKYDFKIHPLMNYITVTKK
jgi:predicted amidophosphoribosyltransferase